MIREVSGAQYSFVRCIQASEVRTPVGGAWVRRSLSVEAKLNVMCAQPAGQSNKLRLHRAKTGPKVVLKKPVGYLILLTIYDSYMREFNTVGFLYFCTKHHNSINAINPSEVSLWSNHWPAVFKTCHHLIHSELFSSFQLKSFVTTIVCRLLTVVPVRSYYYPSEADITEQAVWVWLRQTWRLSVSGQFHSFSTPTGFSRKRAAPPSNMFSSFSSFIFCCCGIFVCTVVLLFCMDHNVISLLFAWRKQ